METLLAAGDSASGVGGRACEIVFLEYLIIILKKNLSTQAINRIKKYYARIFDSKEKYGG